MACVAGQRADEEKSASGALQGVDGASDDEQAVKVLHAFRSKPQEEDPAFEKELAALMGHSRAAQPLADAGMAAGGGAQLGAEPSDGVSFQVVLRKGGSRDMQARTVQVGPVHMFACATGS